MMNYRTILSDFSPVEWGDFLIRFEINRRSYVLFSPEQGKVSCLELMYFTELDPLQLSVLLGIKVESEPMDEFVFRTTCSRDRLIDYLFDVKAGGGSVKQKHVSGWKAYLMTDVVREDKVRNICQFNIETKESELVFDNRCCAAGVRTGEKGKLIHFCWDPSLFFAIDRGGERDAPAYLLASDSPVVEAFALRKIGECFDKELQPDRQIAIHVGSTPYEALSLMACYVCSVQPAMNIRLERRGGIIVMEVVEWNPLAFSNFVASLNVEVRNRCGIDQQSKFAPFLLQSQFRKTFLTFPDVEVFLTVFLHQYLSALKLPEIHLM